MFMFVPIRGRKTSPNLYYRSLPHPASRPQPLTRLFVSPAGGADGRICQRVADIRWRMTPLSRPPSTRRPFLHVSRGTLRCHVVSFFSFSTFSLRLLIRFWFLCIYSSIDCVGERPHHHALVMEGTENTRRLTCASGLELVELTDNELGSWFAGRASYTAAA